MVIITLSNIIFGGGYIVNIDSKELRNIEKEKITTKAFADSILLSSFLKVIHNIIEVGSKINNLEMAMLIDSINHWIIGRGEKKKGKKYSPGTIIEVEFGLSYKTETPYRHSAIVIKDLTNKVLVVPSTSKSDFVNKAYHPIDNPDGDIHFRKVGENDNFDHDCVLIMNDMKTISKNRIISICGFIETQEENCLYKEIRRNLLKIYFDEEMQEYEEKISELNNTVSSYKETVYNKKGIIDSLYKIIDKKDRYIKRLEKHKRY